MITIYSHALNCKLYASRCIGKLDSVGQDIDYYLLKLHVIADIVVADTTGNTAFIVKSLLITLGHYHSIDLFEHVTERELFLADYELA